MRLVSERADFGVFLDLKGLGGNNSSLPMALAFDLNRFFVNLVSLPPQVDL